MPNKTAEASPRLLLRIGGLPTSELEPFSSDLPRTLARHAEVAQDLDAARQDLVDRLHQAIPEAGPEVRGFLLEVKRDGYNGRPLTPHRDHAFWPEVERRADGAASRVVGLEETLEIARRDYQTHYRSCREAEHEQLLRLRKQPRFVRGLALASPPLVAGIRRLPERFDGKYNRKQRKAAQSLLRYASRAVCKLSPYSTLTPVALAGVRDGEDAELRLEPGPWSERSLLRARRFVPSQWVHWLFSHPSLRSRLRVTLNNSLTEVAAGCLLLLRPGAWTTEADRLQYRRDALVTLNLRGPLVDWLRAELPRRELTYRDLLPALGEALTTPGEPAPTVEELTAAVEKLLEAGLLTLKAPWPLDEPHLEKRLLAALKALSNEADLRGLDPVIGALERLVELQLEYAQTEEPARVVRSLHGLLDEIWNALIELVEPSRRIEGDWSGTGVFYEDVFLTPGAAATTEPRRDTLLELPRGVLDDLHRTLTPLCRISDLVNHRHDLNLALAALMEQRWPERSEVGFLELLDAARELWNEFTRFEQETRRSRKVWATFDPGSLPAAAELLRERLRVFKALPTCLESDGEQSRIPRPRLEEIADAIPRRWISPIGNSLVAQPANPAGELWVLHRVAEGTGRLISRFTPVMDPAVRRRLLSRLSARSELESGGERYALLDLPIVQGDTLNVHAPQTRKMLEPPGETLDLPPGRRVTLRELRVHRTGDATLRLSDGRGSSLLPVYLGVADLVYLPVWAKLLARLGPGEVEMQRPNSTVRRENGIEVRERLTLGRLVLHRRRWRIAPDRLPRDLGRHGDPESFAALHRWRRELNLPECLYVIERRPVPGRQEIYKPQYLNLTSPLFAEIFLGILDDQGDQSLVLEEALPAPDAYLQDGAESRRAVEVAVEGLPPLSPEDPQA